MTETPLSRSVPNGTPTLPRARVFERIANRTTVVLILWALLACAALAITASELPSGPAVVTEITQDLRAPYVVAAAPADHGRIEYLKHLIELRDEGATPAELRYYARCYNTGEC